TRPLGTNDGLKITAVGRSPKPCRAGSNPAARAKFLDVRELPKVIPTPTLVLPAPSPRSRGPPSQNPNAPRSRPQGGQAAVCARGNGPLVDRARRDADRRRPR